MNRQYMDNIVDLTFLRLAQNSFLGCSYLDSRNLGTVYTIANRAAPLCTVKCALQRGINISKSEIVVGFPRYGHI